MPRRDVGDAHRGVGDVHVLSAGAARPVRVDAEILFVDLDVDVLRQFRPHEHRRKRGMPPRRLIERRNPHEPVHAGLGGQQPVRVVADDHERRALQARFVARLVVHQLALEAAALGPAQIHPEQHLGPVLRLGAAGAGMDGHDRVLAIVLAAEHLLDFAGLHFLVEDSRPWANSPSTGSPASIHSDRTVRSSLLLRSDTTRSRSCSTRRRRWRIFWASAWSFQKSGDEAWLRCGRVLLRVWRIQR